MPAELPGYYFDASKNKYFRIQPNHVAPAGSKHSRQAVNAETVKEVAEQQQASKNAAQRRAKVVRSKLLHHPLLSFRRQLGDLTISTSEMVARQYGLTTRPHDVYFSSPGGKFSVDRSNNSIYALSASDRDRYSEFGVFKWNRKGLIYSPSLWTSILDARDIVCIAPFTPETVVWVSLSEVSRSATNMTASVVHFSTRFEPIDVRWNRSDFGDYGTVRMVLDETVWEIAASPARDSFVLASSTGVKLHTAENPTEFLTPVHMPKAEQMTVAFKDDNVYMSGARSGKVNFGDKRGGHTMRLKHLGAVSDLRLLRNDNYILVNGLEQMSIYDLRFVGMKKRNRHSKHHRSSQSLLDFDLPGNRGSKRYGLGFDYDAELNLVASASTDFAGLNRVGLWSAGTGKMIDSPLNRFEFGAPVTCIQWADVRDEVKSLLTLSDGKLQEWSPHGREDYTRKPG